MKEPKTYKGKLSIIVQIATWTADIDENKQPEEEGLFLNELIAAIQNRLGDVEGSEILEKYGFKWDG
jgi:hypothetical protein